jgi:hypothetical protein
MTSLFCFLALSHEFGESPIEAEFLEGQKIYARKKGIDRTEKDARVVIGNWFDGERLQVVEEAVFLTPGLLSRWLGYQQASGTSKEDVDKSWQQFTSQFAKRPSTLIRLARLDTVDPIDGNVESTASPTSLDDVKIDVRQVGKDWKKLNYRVVQDLLERNPSEVLRETWSQVLAKFAAWPCEPTTNDLMPILRWGKNRRISLIAETPELEAGSKCELKIVEKDRTRTIRFTYPKS